MVVQLYDTEKAEKLFGNWPETIIWSCLQKVMGEIYADGKENPQSAMAILGDFCFFAGEPNRELVMYRPKSRNKDFVVMVSQNGRWDELITECYGDRAKRATRYAIKKEPVFDRKKLELAAQALPPGYEMNLIDRKSYDLCMAQEWSRDLVAQFESYEMYERLGLGVVVMKDNTPVSGASSYSRYSEGIEIEIDTKPEFRRRGLAYACGARLILECLGRGLYPSWDAHNMGSVKLAEKLGYCLEGEYEVWEVEG